MAYPKTLLGKVATHINLEKAWSDISRSAKPLSHGMSEQTIQDFRANYKGLLDIIRGELLGNNYRFSLPRAVTISKKGGDKRPLRIADIRDRVVQRAITRVLSKRLDKLYHLDNPASYAYIEKRGVQTAIKQMLTYHQDGYTVVLEADIKSFFDTVNRDKLLEEMIFPALSDNTINQLIADTFKMEIGNKNDLPEEDWELYPESSGGLPQGGYLSPLFSNVYLSTFDLTMTQAGFKLIRYADDFIVMCKTIQEAENAHRLALDILERKLGLSVHPRDDNNKKAKTRIVSVSQKPIVFLGIGFNGTRIYADGEKRQKLTYKMIRLRSQTTVRKLLNSANNLIQGWIAAYGFTDITDLYATEIDEEMNKHLWSSLKRMGWALEPRYLSTLQRLNSGVGLAKMHLDSVRKGISTSDKELFSKYWTS